METALSTIKDQITSQIGDLIKNGAQITSIETAAQANAVQVLGLECAKAKKVLDNARLEATAPLRAQVDVINELYKVEGIDPLDRIVKNCKEQRRSFDDRMELIRREEQRKIYEAARKERERIEAEARVQRGKEDTSRKQADEARIAAENTSNEAEKAKLLLEASKADSRADSWGEKADLKETTASSIVAQVVAPSVASGYTPIWKFKMNMETLDKRKFIEFCLNEVGFDALSFLDVNEVNVNKILNAFKGNITLNGAEVVKYDVGRLKKV